jgi:RNA polymerase sigma factor (sigma-70 family)
MKLDESALIVSAQAGDVAAFGELVRLHRDVAFRVAWSIAPDQAEEALQDGCIKAFRALDRFRPGAPWRPWFIRIVANEAKNRARAASRRLRLARRSWDPTLAGSAASAEDEVVGHAEAERAIAAFHELDELHRAVVVCRIFLELSVAETASALDIPEGTVKSRLARALDRLEAML